MSKQFPLELEDNSVIDLSRKPYETNINGSDSMVSKDGAPLVIPDTERLRFRLLTPEDAELFYELDQDPDVMRYINGGTTPSMADILNISVPRMLSYTNSALGWGQWKATRLEDDVFLGWILVRPMSFFTDSPTPDDLELGWRFKQMSWGKGYATEAAKQIMMTLNRERSIETFSAIAHKDNLASISIMKKLGMEFIGQKLYQDPTGDIDVVHYQLSIEA